MANEKRLIDANALKDALRTNEGAKALGHSVHRLFCVDEIIDEQSTVDALEVVHGRWINPYMNRYGHPCHCCSVCGFKASYQDKNYCPNCGADMRGMEE